MATKSPASQCHLDPVNFDDEEQFTELQRQRLACGWDHDSRILQKWKQKQQENLKSLFWIAVPSTSTEKSNTAIRAGHIALDAYCDPLDPDPAAQTSPSFFILPEYRSHGLGRRAMQLVEGLAVREPYGSPRCRVVALTALSKRYLYDEGPEWRGLWARIGEAMPSFSIQEWYENLGYSSWKEEVLYEVTTLDGQVIRLWEAFMRKEVQLT
ncbi:hypothetical protein NUU61_001159 [Penicillium alfredii]|uniref:N-acetyltransferase domain-containing protein n=1 Tax=Penicillium alfredii TaxID=1506179 RepID=A0A9W9GCB8_9EURO|nr:uncharacterized protein NUU61_001159 [Penicillium alfredii]KAJ5115400.1 hypothetical protein NUU61_001159 [Penicillium alfredii]